MSCEHFPLKPCRPTYFSIKLNAVILISQDGQLCKIVLISLNVGFVFKLANIADADEMPRSVSFHLGLHHLQKYQFRCLLSARVDRGRCASGCVSFEHFSLILCRPTYFP